MGVSHRPGFGLLGSVPRSLSTEPPFATQALIKKERKGNNVEGRSTRPVDFFFKAKLKLCLFSLAFLSLLVIFVQSVFAIILWFIILSL